jgi:hypothetical protein
MIGGGAGQRQGDGGCRLGREWLMVVPEGQVASEAEAKPPDQRGERRWGAASWLWMADGWCQWGGRHRRIRRQDGGGSDDGRQSDR